MKTFPWLKTALIVLGSSILLSGLGLLLAPEWFFENIGFFPPFNRHYAGDTGSFMLPWGLALLIAARDPFRNRILIGLSAVSTLLHTANHVYDSWTEGLTVIETFSEIGVIALQTALILAIFLIVSKGQPIVEPGSKKG